MMMQGRIGVRVTRWYTTIPPGASSYLFVPGLCERRLPRHSGMERNISEKKSISEKKLDLKNR